MGVEAEALKYGLVLLKSQGFDDLVACDAASGGGRFGLVSTYHRFEVGAVFGGVEETAGSNVDRTFVLQFGVRHGGTLYPDTILMSVEEHIDSTGAKEVLVKAVLWNNSIFKMKLLW